MKNISIQNSINNYSEILNTFGATYVPFEHYWLVGEITKVQGWILHLSVIEIQVTQLFYQVIPELLKEKVAFKIVMDQQYVFKVLEGSLGYKNVGKIMCIYPNDESQSVTIAKKLISVTASFRGPAVPTDHHLGGIVYTRFGSFNPLLVKNRFGELIKHIYDLNGQLIVDTNDIPFKLPPGLVWPFQEINSLQSLNKKKLLNNSYYPLYILKPDAKGDVIKALYFRKPWQIKSCLLKQGRRNMFTDGYGRDIQDRLQWQYELYKALNGQIPMPKVFNYFTENGDTYLAMEFITGVTLTNWILNNCNERCWRHLSNPQKIQSLDLLIKLIKIIQRMHEKGYVHRDITPDNFIIDKKNNVFLIDMELTWCLATQQPAPPFQLGTPGHMSPEQLATHRPTIKEDIFGIGSLMITFFTGLHALKVKNQTPSQLKRSLTFFTDDSSIATWISSCWNDQPSERPQLLDLLDLLVSYLDDLKKGKVNSNSIDTSDNCLNQSDVRRLLQLGFNNFSSPAVLNHKQRWTTLSQHRESYIGNMQASMVLSEGWHTGMAGPLWLVALAKEIGLDIDPCRTPYTKSWEYIQENYFSSPPKQAPGFYTGSAGIALALVEGLNSGLLKPDPSLLGQLEQLFSLTTNNPDLANGIAGQGISLLKCSLWLNASSRDIALTSYVNILLKTQFPNGAWNTHTGLDHGTAGIVLFLLCYLELHPEDEIRSAALKAMDWLTSNCKKKAGNYYWPVSVGSKYVDFQSISFGIPGITLAMIKAYEVLGVKKYQEIALSSLENMPPYPVRMNLSLGSGLSGWGELYMEAIRVFKDPVWEQRAAWILKVLLHTFQPSQEETGHWFVDMNTMTTADLFSGNGGLLHFLMRFTSPNEISHPLLYKSIVHNQG